MTAVASSSAALRPLIEALLSAARDDAARITARADQVSAQTLADARAQAAAIVDQARRDGETDAEAVLAAARSGARRAARETLLHVQRAAYDELHQRCRTAAAAVTADPGHARLRYRLGQTAWRVLGEDAVVREADGGGVIGEVAGRRLDLSMASFTDTALAELAWQLFGDDRAGVPEPAVIPGGRP